MSRRSRRARPRAASVAQTVVPLASSGRSPRPFAALLLVSGATALVFETLWVKQLGRVVGVEVHAVSLALSAFFAGLALGGTTFGRSADRTTRPLRLYAALEAGAAALGFAATLALARAAPLFAPLQDTVGVLAWALPFTLVGLPALLMGGTLPALLRALRPGDDSVPAATGLLYGANTIGAVVGTLATPLLLVPAVGITRSALVAALLGLVVAAAALVLDRREAAPVEAATPLAPPRPAGAHLALALYAVAGGIALGYEVVWSELLVPFLSTRAHAFAVMLATYLAGLAIGSLAFSRGTRSEPTAWRTFGLLLGAAAASAAGAVLFLGAWLPSLQTTAGTWALRLTGRETIEVLARFVVATSAVVLLPTLFLGAAFPAAARLAAGAARVGRDVGTVAAVNTAGGIAGSLLTGFVLVPRLGLVRAIGVLAVAGAVVGAIAVVKVGSERAA
jgi:predicted membrane-bound spermidine synthase